MNLLRFKKGVGSAIFKHLKVVSQKFVLWALDPITSVGWLTRPPYPQTEFTIPVIVPRDLSDTKQ